MKKHSTKRALLASVLALCMCFTMLVGTTFAWFTDTASSEGNVIKTGTLKIGFDKWDGTAWVDATAKDADGNSAIFNYDKWEPGYTQIVNLRVTNLGNLAIAWKAAITTEKNLSILADVIYVYVKSDDTSDTVRPYLDTLTVASDLDALADAGEFTKFTLRDFVENFTALTKGTLKEGQESYLGLVLQMDPDAGNEYQGLDLGGKFDITILATQAAYESDSNGNQYDAGAEYPVVLSGYVPVVDGQSSYEIKLKNPAGGYNGSVLIPAGAVVDGATGVSASVIETTLDDRIAVGANKGATTLEIKVNGLRDDNAENVKVQLTIEEGLTNLILYHENSILPEGDYTYNPNNGELEINTTNFSPFTYVYDANGEYEAPETDGLEPPKATVVYYPEWVNTEIEWGDYGQWAPTEGLDATLDAAFVFTCPELSEEVYEAYKNWYCDFYVSLDRDLGANEIFLGGQYDTWLVGFHNGDMTLEANTEIGLLGTALSGGKSNWTYEMVADFVEVFTCGVGDAQNKLDGATFTVKLRLTNPEDETETYDVNVVTHTFGGNSVIDGVTVVTTAEGLQDAINNGDGNISLGGDIDLGNGGIVIP
ncbi:MAG: SipW-dependent-type signal peptide-containing protein [Clostridia bacterium]|nr:SipW-dependent-type signal peptide-containing protein [Clostridia bacterium]